MVSPVVSTCLGLDLETPMNWFDALIAKSSSADIVLLFGIGAIVWLVATKRKIDRETVEIALKYITWIVFATIGMRTLITIVDVWKGG